MKLTSKKRNQVDIIQVSTRIKITQYCLGNDKIMAAAADCRQRQVLPLV